MRAPWVIRYVNAAPRPNLAAGAQVIEIADKLSDFEQLSTIVEADLAALDADRMPTGWRDSAVEGSLEFGFADAQQLLPKVKCRVGVTVDAVCQRCLEAFRLPLEAEADLLLLALEQDADGYDELEVWELEETFAPAAGHRGRNADHGTAVFSDACGFGLVQSAFAGAAEESAEKTTTPFAALRDQMATG